MEGPRVVSGWGAGQASVASHGPACWMKAGLGEVPLPWRTVGTQKRKPSRGTRAACPSIPHGPCCVHCVCLCFSLDSLISRFILHCCVLCNSSALTLTLSQYSGMSQFSNDVFLLVSYWFVSFFTFGTRWPYAFQRFESP